MRRAVTRRRRRTRGRRRRVLALGGALLVGLAAGLVVANRDQLSDTIREVTLPLRHDDIIRQQADDKEVPPDLIAAVIYAESRFRDQTSEAGARGLMQVTPATAQAIADKSRGTEFETTDLSDPQVNISYGTFHLRELLDQYGGNEVAALAAYNAGSGNVDQWGGASLREEDIPFAETREYVDDVQEKRTDYAENYSDELGLD